MLLDSVFKVTGATQAFPGMKAGMRAAQLPDSGVDLPSGFLASLGRPSRESACECESSSDLRLGSVMSLLSGPAVSGAVDDPGNAIASLVKRESDDRKVIDELFVRILNRHARPDEIETALKSMSRQPADHLGLTNSLVVAEKAWVPVLAQKEADRLVAIAKTKGELEAYEKETAPAVAAKEKERADKIAAAEKALAGFAPKLTNIVEQFASTLTDTDRATIWTEGEIKDLKSTGATKLEKQKDGSILAKGGETENPEYTVTIETALANITGVKIEVLPHESLPGFGPGRKDGNFLLSEVKFDWLPRGETNARAKPVVGKFIEAKADLVEKDHDLKFVFDGKTEQGKREGWAIGTAEKGRPHWITLKLDKPAGSTPGATNGSKINIGLHHRFQAPYSIGRFRVFLTTDPDPLAAGLPAEVAAAVAHPAAQRSSEQNEAIRKHVESHDKDYLKLDQALTVAKRPLPEDPKLKERQTAFSKASEPVRTDPALVQLRTDAKTSEKQLVDPRLTAAQDLAWALINHPAFLFNR